MTESKAELNAGLIIITGHTATQLEDIDMDTETPDASMPAASAAHPDVCDTRAQGAWLIQLTVNPQRNGSPHCVTAEPVS